MSPSICPHLGRRRGKDRDEPVPTPSGKNCCYARLPEEDPAVPTANWLRRLGLTSSPGDIPCLPAGRGHQATFCLTEEHIKCKLYHPPES